MDQGHLHELERKRDTLGPSDAEAQELDSRSGLEPRRRKNRLAIVSLALGVSSIILIPAIPAIILTGGMTGPPGKERWGPCIPTGVG